MRSHFPNAPPGSSCSQRPPIPGPQRGLQIAEEIERLGATLSVGSTSDFSTVAASSLSIYADEVLELLADVTLRSTFPQNEVDLARENTKQLLIQQRAQPNFLASERMAKVIFGAHPYSSISPTEEMLDALTRDDLLSFRVSTFIPNNAEMVVIGDFQHDDLMARIEALFAGWGRGDASPVPSPHPQYSFPTPCPRWSPARRQDLECAPRWLSARCRCSEVLSPEFQVAD